MITYFRKDDTGMKSGLKSTRPPSAATPLGAGFRAFRVQSPVPGHPLSAIFRGNAPSPCVRESLSSLAATNAQSGGTKDTTTVKKTLFQALDFRLWQPCVMSYPFRRNAIGFHRLCDLGLPRRDPAGLAFCLPCGEGFFFDEDLFSALVEFVLHIAVVFVPLVGRKGFNFRDVQQ